MLSERFLSFELHPQQERAIYQRDNEDIIELNNQQQIIIENISLFASRCTDSTQEICCFKTSTLKK